jgi:HK97 family phage portal protein
MDLKATDLTFSTTDIRDARWYLQNGYPHIAGLLSGGMPAWSGETVTPERAMNHSVVWACNRIVSEPMGFLPANVMQEVRGEKREATELPSYSLLKHLPNEEITAQSFREMLTSHCLLQGDGFAQITRRSGTGVAIELHPLLPGQVMIEREKTGAKRLVYIVKEENQPDKRYPLTPGKPHDIFHLRGLGWDGLRGYSIIHMGRQSIGSAIAAERNVARFWANGGRVPYILETAKHFKSQDDFKAFRKDWEDVYGEPGRAPILTDDLKYKQVGLSMADAQALQSRQFSIPEICRWFSVSPHLVGDLSRATFANIEHLALEFVKMTLATWINRWEQEFWRSVLTAEERAAGYFLKYNVDALLRGDFKTRMEGYASALQNGHMNVDEVRDLEDRNALPNGIGKHYHIQTNMGTLARDGQIQPATSALIRLDEDEEAA